MHDERGAAGVLVPESTHGRPARAVHAGRMFNQRRLPVQQSVHEQQVRRSLRGSVWIKRKLPDQKSHRYLRVYTRIRRRSVLGLSNRRPSSCLQAEPVRNKYPMRGNQRGASLHVPTGLPRLALGRLPSRVRERQRLPSSPRVLVVVQMREPVQVRRERGVRGHPSSGAVHLPENMDGKSINRMPTGVHHPLRVPAEQARLPLSEMRESLRRRVRRERRLQPTRHHPRLQLPETHDRQSFRQLQTVRTTRSLRAESLRR